MKILFTLAIVSYTLLATANAQSSATDSTGLPGDHFSLEGALELFKRSASPEEFEKLLNAENNDVNNLDLNEDGQVDYIRVIDKMESDAHAMILQVPVSTSENQDIAVIEIEKTGDQEASLQIIGDEDIYGETRIVEPSEEDNSSGIFYNDLNAVAHGPYVSETPARVIVNVWFWSPVRFIFQPSYRVWISPWGWARHPGWYRPWRVVAWRVFYPRHIVYHNHFIVTNRHRLIRAHNMYRPVRVTSVTVRTRTQPRMTVYRATRKTTVVHQGRGGKKTVIHKRTRGARGRR